jgi:hypothetical protein
MSKQIAGTFAEMCAAYAADPIPSETNTLGFFAKQFQQDEGCSFREALEALAYGVIPNDGMGESTAALARVIVTRHGDGSIEISHPKIGGGA